jgi:hypothetical protein
MITYGSIVGHVLKWGTTGLEENFHQRSEWNWMSFRCRS